MPRGLTGHQHLTLDSSIGEGRGWLQAHYHKAGIRCLMCTQSVGLYRRRIGHLNAVFLAFLAKLTMEHPRGQKWFHKNEIFAKYSASLPGGDYTWLTHLGLAIPAAEKHKNELPTKRRSGYWQITSFGKQFVSGEVTIPKYFWTYNGRIETYKRGPHRGEHMLSVEQVSIQDCFKRSFDYSEMMSWCEER